MFTEYHWSWVKYRKWPLKFRSLSLGGPEFWLFQFRKLAPLCSQLRLGVNELLIWESQWNMKTMKSMISIFSVYIQHLGWSVYVWRYFSSLSVSFFRHKSSLYVNTGVNRVDINDVWVQCSVLCFSGLIISDKLSIYIFPIFNNHLCNGLLISYTTTLVT